MGNNNSSPLGTISKQQIVDYVANLGEKFEDYAKAVDQNGVDGDLLACMEEEEFNETLDDLGIISRLHRRKLLREFRKQFHGDGTTASTSSVSGRSIGSAGHLSEDDQTSVEGGGMDSAILPAYGPVSEVTIRDIEFRESDYPYPDELRDGEVRHSNMLPAYNRGVATAEQQAHLAPDFWKIYEGLEGAYRPPIPADDVERVAQVQNYELEGIEPGSEIAETLTGYVEMATKMFKFDLGDITFFDNESQFSFARVGLTDHIQKAIAAKVLTPLNYHQDGTTAFLCKANRSVAICNYPNLTKRTFVVHDIHNDETFKWLKAAWPFRCYVGTPLLAPSGLVLGTLCLHNLVPRPDFSRAHEVQLEQVAKMVVQAIESWHFQRNIEKRELSREIVTVSVSASGSKKFEPPKDHATFVSTGVEGSTNLHKANPTAMKKALELHDNIIRKLREQYKGYEVEAEGDSFLLAFHDPVDAFGFSLEMQKQLYDAPWEADILKIKQARDDGNSFRGLRVRIGVEMGDVENETNPVTGRVQYSGRALEIAKAVESMGHGGQILTTFETWNAASHVAETQLGSPQVLDLGSHVVRKGKIVSDGVISKAIVQLLPCSLAIKYNELANANDRMDLNVNGRRFSELKTMKRLSKGFHDAPNGKNVTIAFVGCGEIIETRYKESARLIAEITAHAASLLPGSEGYQCQSNMFAFPNITEAVKFGLNFMDLMRMQKPLADGGLLSQLVTYGCVDDDFVAMEPHKTTGRADYFGKVVNRASRVAYSTALGKVYFGEVLARADGKNASEVKDPTIKVKFVGMKQLKGIEEKMALFECERKRQAGKSMMRWFGFK